jgi:hypothetical protein
MVSAVLTETQSSCPLYGVATLTFPSTTAVMNPFLDAQLFLRVTLPGGGTVTVDGYYDGDGVDDSGNSVLFRARVYCGHAGTHHWRSASGIKELDRLKGRITVSGTPAGPQWRGKLRVHSVDHHQFQYDNGDWFLHIGDTGYRYVVDEEPQWREYIDQAVSVMGATKIRTWFARGRHSVDALFHKRKGLNLKYWQVIEERVAYALQRYPSVQLQLIIYGEDWERLAMAASGDVVSAYAARYAQARWSAFPNVHWCVINDVTVATVVDIAAEMAKREPWGTLLTR